MNDDHMKHAVNTQLAIRGSNYDFEQAARMIFSLESLKTRAELGMIEKPVNKEARGM